MVREYEGVGELMGRGHGERQYIGAEIRRLRLERGMTLDDLAAVSVISASHLSRLERGLTLPSFTVLAGLAKALGISLEHFVAMEADIEALNEQLREQLQARGISAAAIEEIVRMRVPARRSLAAALSE